MQLTCPYGRNTRFGYTIALDNAELYYEVYGSGQPLLLLHGNNQSIDAFVNQIDTLSERFRVIAVDTRGHGNSTDESSGGLTYELFAEDMKHLLDDLNLKQVNILGWSDGGITGLILAMKYPEYVNKLAVMGANIFTGPEALKDIVFRDVNELIDDIHGDDMASINQKRIYELVLNEPRLAFEDLEKIESQVLVMAGQNDVVIENHTRRIAEHIPNAELVIFKNAGHYAPCYNPFDFNRAVVDFFIQ